ncbi:hypothetical protein QQS21_004183 [Conoideocrella luteorostrata]|uniref:Uncharacterized protein n=1 Tax=Conoideocrella luteorostrata TaxID=1105319 RepID=A0AAJ0CUP2_9HYPO|nr:hypothetical protein QQS21_004183 [Conoideocrella luteorostrata]
MDPAWGNEVQEAKEPSPSNPLGEAIAALGDNEAICPEMLVAGNCGLQNPFYVPSLAVANVHPAVAEMLKSSALAHRILQGAERPSSDRAVLATKLQRHRGAAIRLMAQDLANDASHTSFQFLVCVLVFLLIEIQQSISSSWRSHVDAALVIIDRHGGLGRLLATCEPLTHFLRYVTIIDILGATTTPCLEFVQACRQLKILPILSTLFGDGLQTCVPCPPELLGHVILVNHLRSRMQNTVSQDGSVLVLPAAWTALKSICEFSVDHWVDSVVLPSLALYDVHRIDKNARRSPKFTVPQRRLWLALTSCFKSAITVYCISTLFGDGYALHYDELDETIYGHTDLPGAKLFHQETLMSNLQTIASDQGSQVRKFTIWPLTIAGLRTQPGDEASKRFILTELMWMSEKLGTASPLIAADLLNKTWREASIWPDGEQKAWDSLFDKPYVFAL